MSLVTNISNVVTRIATENKALRTLINGNAADLSALTTTQKASLVGALNEVRATVVDLIDDSSNSSSKTWSSTKIDSAIATAIAGLVGTAPSALDTLQELAAALQGDGTTIAGLVTAVAAKVNSTDIGDVATNFVTTFEAGL